MTGIGRKRSRSPLLEDQSSEEKFTLEGRNIEMQRISGHTRTRRTARMRVLTPIIFKFSPVRSVESSTGDNSDLEVGEVASDTDSTTSSRAPEVKLAFDPHPDDYLWQCMKKMYLYQYNSTILSCSTSLLYNNFLFDVWWLYNEREKYDLCMSDDIWIKTTLAHFPDTALWVKTKNDIVARGPYEFSLFFDLMHEHIRKYM